MYINLRICTRVKGCNMPMGPLQLADFIGLDTCLAIMKVCVCVCVCIFMCICICVYVDIRKCIVNVCVHVYV